MPSVAMKPTYLPEVEANPQPGFYRDLIEKAQAGGAEYWQIWHLFAFRPETTVHLSRLTEGFLREPSSVSLGMRELVAAYTSFLNRCEFCTKCHAAIAAELLGSEALVEQVFADLESSPLEEKDKALLRFVRQVTLDLPSVTENDSATLRAAGWADEAIYYTISVCGLFNFYNRWITASGVHAISDEGHRGRAKMIAREGYIRD
ncbi:MAG: peroxidase-related enzyme [Acidobacteria bacterium]|jgi:uncharacterized peroxidase-related enzyme|nr:peroxidase-related enzyme [Acidobacteriota bacterium]